MTPLERRVKIALGAGLTAPAIARLLRISVGKARRIAVKMALQRMNTELARSRVAMSEKISIQDIDGKPISGQYVVRNGIVIVTASDGRTTRGVIEDSMLSPETLAKTLLLQLHRNGMSTDDQ